jgi:elongation factor P--beta-lysine ligase
MRVLGRRKSLADRLKLRIRQIVGRKQSCSFQRQRLHHNLCQDLNSVPPTYGIALGLEKAAEFSLHFPDQRLQQGLQPYNVAEMCFSSRHRI